MKKDKVEIFLEELSKTPVVYVVCQKVGLSRQTIYRWCAEDRDFKRRFDECIGRGRDSINDLAESKLISLINEGKLRAIEFWLRNNKLNYGQPKSFYYDDAIKSELDRNRNILRELADKSKLKEISGLEESDLLSIRYSRYTDEELEELLEASKKLALLKERGDTD